MACDAYRLAASARLVLQARTDRTMLLTQLMVALHEQYGKEECNAVMQCRASQWFEQQPQDFLVANNSVTLVTREWQAALEERPLTLDIFKTQVIELLSSAGEIPLGQLLDRHARAHGSKRQFRPPATGLRALLQSEVFNSEIELAPWVDSPNPGELVARLVARPSSQDTLGLDRDSLRTLYGLSLLVGDSWPRTRDELKEVGAPIGFYGKGPGGFLMQLRGKGVVTVALGQQLHWSLPIVRKVLDATSDDIRQAARDVMQSRTGSGMVTVAQPNTSANHAQDDDAADDSDIVACATTLLRSQDRQAMLLTQLCVSLQAQCGKERCRSVMGSAAKWFASFPFFRVDYPQDGGPAVTVTLVDQEDEFDPADFGELPAQPTNNGVYVFGTTAPSVLDPLEGGPTWTHLVEDALPPPPPMPPPPPPHAQAPAPAPAPEPAPAPAPAPASAHPSSDPIARLLNELSSGVDPDTPDSAVDVLMRHFALGMARTRTEMTRHETRAKAAEARVAELEEELRQEREKNRALQARLEGEALLSAAR